MEGRKRGKGKEKDKAVLTLGVAKENVSCSFFLMRLAVAYQA
jgi:hypothetical protein